MLGVFPAPPAFELPGVTAPPPPPDPPFLFGPAAFDFDPAPPPADDIEREGLCITEDATPGKP